MSWLAACETVQCLQVVRRRTAADSPAVSRLKKKKLSFVCDKPQSTGCDNFFIVCDLYLFSKLKKKGMIHTQTTACECLKQILNVMNAV